MKTKTVADLVRVLQKLPVSLPVICVMSREGWDWEVRDIEHDEAHNRIVVKIGLGDDK